MKILKCVALVLVLSTVSILPVSAKIIGDNDNAVRSISEPVLDNILKGFKERDYDAYIRDFAPSLKESTSPQKFIKTDKTIKKTIGSCLGKTYLGFLSRGDMTVVLWKAKFSKTKEDVLIKLVMKKNKKGRDLVKGLWFQ